ncbi:MAG: hypothetical protein OXM03_12785 [Chloroflexota bacterium]|nr:hypothetical protein [Chloroflexota bacterium]MDE2841496.1 hypothetical protein [Chloroflexota bacterium]
MIAEEVHEAGRRAGSAAEVEAEAEVVSAGRGDGVRVVGDHGGGAHAISAATPSKS